MTDLTAPMFTDPDAAREHLESIRWPDGPYCPHCGAFENIAKLKGKSHRPGLHYCNACKGQFTVTVGTLFERSKIPLNKWLLAFHLMCASKKGVSAHQLHRMLGITYKSAWFMAHRIREAMASDDLSPFGNDGGLSPFGNDGGAVEVDETFIGRKKGVPVRVGYEHKHKVVALVGRRTGRARSMVVEKLNTKTVREIVTTNIAREARLMADEARHYVLVGREYAGHGVVHHGKEEYVSREDPSVYTNTVEGYFSIFKRGMKGVYQHCGEKHLHRYLAEFDFRYSERAAMGVDDDQRAAKALAGITGKRLTYRRTGEGRASA